MKFRLRPAAINDLENIEAFTVEQWGEDQATRYTRRLQRGIETIAETPTIGHPLPGGRFDYRRYNVVSHAIIFRLTVDELLVVRILHGAMDINRRLGEFDDNDDF